MIVTRLIGGLGNQMFQYAIARSLSVEARVPFYLDISGFDSYKLHKYALCNFNIVENLFDGGENNLFYRIPVLNNILRKYSRKHTVISEQNNEKDISSLPNKNIYLDGYWQSEKYFSGIRDILLNDFKLSVPLSEKSREVESKIKSLNSVALHVRRGDYVTNPITNKVLGTCDLAYYINALEFIFAKIKCPHFFIFSDDHNWTKENIKINAPCAFVEHNDASRNYEDLYLMSLCKHNIIANSSFSWWGAWLNENSEKIVIAPKKWFNVLSSEDLVPNDWQRL